MFHPEKARINGARTSAEDAQRAPAGARRLQRCLFCCRRPLGTRSCEKAKEQRRESVRRFKNEFRLRYSPHPNLVRIHELIDNGSEWLLVMEQLQGETLREALDRNPSGLSSARVIGILQQIAAGLNALHDAGILHRDLKPGNVWLKPGEEVVLLDFGLAAKTERSTHHLSTKLFGTAGYIAPERMERKPDSHASDWYSVGVMVWEMLGRPVARRKRTKPYARISSSNPRVAAGSLRNFDGKRTGKTGRSKGSVGLPSCRESRVSSKTSGGNNKRTSDYRT